MSPASSASGCRRARKVVPRLRRYLAVEFHGGKQQHLVQVQAHSGRGIDGGIQQQVVAFGAQVRAQLGH